MTNETLEEYLIEAAEHLQGLTNRERRSVLADMRTHLEEAVHQLQAEHPDMDVEEATRAAIRDFGEPADLTVAVGPEGGVLRGAGAEMAYRRAPHKDIVFRRAVKWTAAILGTIALVWIGLLVVDSIVSDYDAPDVLYQRHIEHSEVPLSGNETATFEHTAAGKMFSLGIHVSNPESQGCVRVRVVAPDGSLALDTRDMCASGNIDSRFTEAGSWTVETTYTDFQGAMDLVVEA